MPNRPALRFELWSNRLFINKATINLLGGKQYIQFLWDNGNRILLINGTSTKVRDSFALERVSGTNADGEASGYVFQRRAFTDAVILRMRWNRNESYKVLGAYAPRVRMVAFCLDEAVPLGCEGGAENE